MKSSFQNTLQRMNFKLLVQSLSFKENEMCFYAKAMICTLGSAMTNLLYANKNVKHVMFGL